MASTIVWKGSAPVTRQVDTYSIGGTVEVGDVFTITIGSSVFTYTAATTVVATEAAAMAAAIIAAVAAGTYKEFTGLTALYTSGGAFTLTGKTTGEPFTGTAATTEAGGGAADAQTFVKTATTAATSPNHWDNAVNYTGGVVPATGDTLVYENSDVPPKWGATQAAVVLVKLVWADSFTGGCGLPQQHADGYAEYRGTYYDVAATTELVGFGNGGGPGSGRIKRNNGTNQTALTVYKSDTSDESTSGIPAVVWKGTHASNTVTHLGGSLGIGFFGGEVATVATLKVTSGTVVCGSGVTLTTVQHSGTATLTINSACTTLTKDPGSGTLYVLGSGAVTTITVYGGTLNYQGNGTITTLTVGNAGYVTFEDNPIVRTVTNSNFYPGAKIRDRVKSVTWTNDPVSTGADRKDVDALLGIGRGFNMAG